MSLEQTQGVSPKEEGPCQIQLKTCLAIFFPEIRLTCCQGPVGARTFPRRSGMSLRTPSPTPSALPQGDGIPAQSLCRYPEARSPVADRLLLRGTHLPRGSGTPLPPETLRGKAGRFWTKHAGSGSQGGSLDCGNVVILLGR